MLNPQRSTVADFLILPHRYINVKVERTVNVREIIKTTNVQL